MSNLKILAVDDDPITRLLLEKKLKKAEYEVETAKDGVEAVRLISKSYYDVVLTDLIMPGGIDGIGVLETVKKTQSRTEVILLTAYASVDNAVEAMKKGAANYLQKPINFDELLLQLDKINTLNRLVKNAGDLREAMDVTEKNAAQTIQYLEIGVSQLQDQLSEARRILSKQNIDSATRIAMAIDIMENTDG